MADDGSDGFGERQDVQSSETDGRDVTFERVATWAEETRRYRRNPGGWWWLALLAVPALLAALGLAFGGTDTTGATSSGTSTSTSASTSSGASTSASSSSSATTGESTSSTSTPPAGDGTVASDAFAITRFGDAVTVKADVANAAAKTALLDAVKSSLGVSEVTDKVVVSGSKGPAPAAVSAALGALTEAGDFGLAWDLKSLVTTGTVAAEDAKRAVSDALGAAWPGAAIDNGVAVGADAAAACANLGQAITVALADTKITFEKYGTTPNAESVAVLKRVATMAGTCSAARLTVTGYTDASGSESENQALSEARADAVRAVLVDSGVKADQVTAVGKGEADPIASNQTPAGIAANRRVEITVN